MSKKFGKLVLSKETLRNLTTDEAGQINGGALKSQKMFCLGPVTQTCTQQCTQGCGSGSGPYACC